MKTKVCRKCEKEKEVSEFYVHKQMFDGYLNYCKECTKKRVCSHRKNNLEKIQEYDRNRPNKEERNKKQLKRMQNLTPIQKEKAKKIKTTWENKAESKNKKTVNSKLASALRSGIIVKPHVCEHCKKEKSLQGHHPSYLKPLDVIWLCAKCHGVEHAKIRAIERKLKLNQS